MDKFIHLTEKLSDTRYVKCQIEESGTLLYIGQWIFPGNEAEIRPFTQVGPFSPSEAKRLIEVLQNLLHEAERQYAETWTKNGAVLIQLGALTGTVQSE